MLEDFQNRIDRLSFRPKLLIVEIQSDESKPAISARMVRTRPVTMLLSGLAAPAPRVTQRRPRAEAQIFCIVFNPSSMISDQKGSSNARTIPYWSARSTSSRFVAVCDSLEIVRNPLLTSCPSRCSTCPQVRTAAVGYTADRSEIAVERTTLAESRSPGMTRTEPSIPEKPDRLSTLFNWASVKDGPS